ncbi:MAG: cold shock domain-containing protein [Flavobacteriales bacterium]|nr:cold shock domain-containing protein [Flavobacteriales bacterium]
MGRSQETFGKKEREKKKAKKRKEKLARREERKENNTKGEGFDSMIAYVDEYGNTHETPPDPAERDEISAEDIVLGVPKKVKGENDKLKKGKVAFFDDTKGYGFIRERETQEKYFVHVTGLLQEIGENDNVTFELEKGPRGMNCVKVKKI